VLSIHNNTSQLSTTIFVATSRKHTASTQNKRLGKSAEKDFESGASASFATPASRFNARAECTVDNAKFDGLSRKMQDAIIALAVALTPKPTAREGSVACVEEG
jgi:hypothetical protein